MVGLRRYIFPFPQQQLRIYHTLHLLLIIMIMKLKILGRKYWSLRLEKPHELKEKEQKEKEQKEKEKREKE